MTVTLPIPVVSYARVGLALARARLRNCLGYPDVRRLRGADARPLRCRRRHRAPLRLGLAAFAPTQTGKGSGVLNSGSFLGGTVGVTGGGIASASRVRRRADVG